MGPLLILNLLLLFQPTLQAANCYFPDGTFAEFDSPCFPDQEASICCGQGHTCMSNSLCRWPDSQMLYPLAYIRGSCTDSSWNNSKCGDVCKTVFPSQWDPIVACPGAEFCCELGSNNPPSCCNLTNTTAHPIYQLGAASTVTVIGASPTRSAAVSTATVTTTSTPTPSSLVDGNASGSMGAGEKIGIGVGVGVGVVLVLAGVGLLFCIRKRRAGSKIRREGGPSAIEQHNAVIPKAELPAIPVNLTYNNAPKEKREEGFQVTAMDSKLGNSERLQEMP